ncbi:UV DNA damage repair endonuclease UvsE [Anaeroselena agilis]|uniref:UV DNA damage repair endonuclease UvsE n=1 Tax=Anaeroselena agilis TaxID=3063788 RepID=A0ABU3P060_9FIRM|nr:UV DNA damage repair endonuclease UvsE [Selenomonadales bacterium 4137-cl]
MRVRFGYVAIALGVPEGSPNKTASVKTIEKIADPLGRIGRLRRLMTANLETTLRILRYNAAHGIHVYRFTSKTVPLATHPLAADWDYIADGGPLWREIGDYARLHGMRVSAHPDHYTLLNSPKPEVLAASLADLDYHARMFEAMGLPPSPSLVLHVGGQYREKNAALRRFAGNFARLPDRLAARLMLENDDKIFTAAEVLGLCEELGRPMVLDIHHHRVNGGGDLEELWPRIAATWGEATPKIHVSSPKDDKDMRAHADYVDPADVLPFLRLARETGRDLDVMVEAKRKDEAMFRLVEGLAAAPEVRRAGQATVEL